MGVFFYFGWFGEEVGDIVVGDVDDGSFCEGLRIGWDGVIGWFIWIIFGRVIGWGCFGRVIIGVGGVIGMFWVGFIIGGLGLYILGSVVLDGLGRFFFGLLKIFFGVFNEVKIYRFFVKVLVEIFYLIGYRLWIKDICRCCLIKNRVNKV